MNSIEINNKLLNATRRLVNDCKDQGCSDFSPAIDGIRKVYIEAAQNFLSHTLDAKSVTSCISFGLSEIISIEPEKLIPVFEAFPFMAREYNASWIRDLNPDIYKAWSHALLKSFNYASRQNPRLILNVELKWVIEYAIKKNDGLVFAEAIKIIDEAFNSMPMNNGQLDLFMSDFVEIIGAHHACPENDTLLADFLSNISIRMQSEDLIPNMALKHLNLLDSIGYQKAVRVIIERYMPSAGHAKQLSDTKSRFGSTICDDMLGRALSHGPGTINLYLAPALAFYKIAEGHEQDYEPIFYNLKEQQNDAIRSVLCDVLKHLEKASPAFMAFLAQALKASTDEQGLFRVAMNKNWKNDFERAAKRHPLLSRYVLGHDLGI